MRLKPSSDDFSELKAEHVTISPKIKALVKNISYCLSLHGTDLPSIVPALVLLDRSNEEYLCSIDLEGEIHPRALPSLEIDLKDVIGGYVNWLDALANGLAKIFAEGARLTIEQRNDENIEISVTLSFGPEIGKVIPVKGFANVFAVDKD